MMSVPPSPILRAITPPHPLRPFLALHLLLIPAAIQEAMDSGDPSTTSGPSAQQPPPDTNPSPTPGSETVSR